MSNDEKKQKPVEFKCPHCGTALRAQPEVLGKGRNCPKCKNRITVPGGQESTNNE